MKRKDLLLGSGVLFVACVLFLVMNLMQYVQARDSLLVQLLLHRFIVRF
jgi:hypothetical protein